MNSKLNQLFSQIVEAHSGRDTDDSIVLTLREFSKLTRSQVYTKSDQGKLSAKLTRSFYNHDIEAEIFPHSHNLKVILTDDFNDHYHKATARFETVDQAVKWIVLCAIEEKVIEPTGEMKPLWYRFENPSYEEADENEEWDGNEDFDEEDTSRKLSVGELKEFLESDSSKPLSPEVQSLVHKAESFMAEPFSSLDHIKLCSNDCEFQPHELRVRRKAQAVIWYCQNKDNEFFEKTMEMVDVEIKGRPFSLIIGDIGNLEINEVEEAYMAFTDRDDMGDIECDLFVVLTLLLEEVQAHNVSARNKKSLIKRIAGWVSKDE